LLRKGEVIVAGITGRSVLYSVLGLVRRLRYELAGMSESRRGRWTARHTLTFGRNVKGKTGWE